MNEIIEEELISLDGFIKHYKYENSETGYKIATFKIDDNKQERTITIVGYFPHFNSNDGVTIKGVSINHPRYGLQFEVKEIYKKLPTSKDNIILFLRSSQFKGIGKKCATAIYNYLKDDAISLLINEPDYYNQLLDNKIISEEQCNSLKKGLQNYDFKSSAFQLLLRYGFSLKNIMKAEAVYGELLNDVILHDPYQLAVDIEGIAFKTIDKLALNMQIKEDDPRRVKACILYSLLTYCHNSGDTYTSSLQLYNQFSKIITLEKEIFLESLNELEKEQKIHIIDKKIYHHTLYKAEEDISKQIKKYANKKVDIKKLDIHFDELIDIVEKDDGIKYSKEQLDAIYGALSNGLYIITGGPGTGKTTILNAIIKIIKMLYGNEHIISLCAPTGRASKRMSMLANNYACTIHRLLKWDLHSNSFAHNEGNKLKTNVIIIDEFSMVDTLLFDALLKGVGGVNQIILIGDDGQIPSVGAGNLLHDLLQIRWIKNYKLNRIYRQLVGSSIVDLAFKIRFNKLDNTFDYTNDVRFYKLKNYQASKTIISILKKALDSEITFDDIQVIVPMYGTIAGIDSINASIQECFNPYQEDKTQIKIGHQIFRVGDRVLQLKNQPEDDIFNGDIGYIIDIDLKENEIIVQFDTGVVIYPKGMQSNLTLAYAISVHKSQGSEFDYVIMCVFPEYGFMLNKQLIYTAITRAKKSLFILGDYETFIYKSMSENKRQRNTSLVEMANKNY